jgi:hypothetical protein
MRRTETGAYKGVGEDFEYCLIWQQRPQIAGSSFSTARGPLRA